MIQLTFIKESTRAFPSPKALSVPTVQSSPTLLFTSGMRMTCPESQTLPQQARFWPSCPSLLSLPPSPGRCFIQWLRVEMDSVPKPHDALQYSTPMIELQVVNMLWRLKNVPQCKKKCNNKAMQLLSKVLIL